MLGEKNKLYKTKNLNIASCLNIFKDEIHLIDVDKSNPQEISFVFDNPNACLDLVNKYWNGQTRVDAKKILSSLNELKDRMFN